MKTKYISADSSAICASGSLKNYLKKFAQYLKFVSVVD